ncbi:14510_t:CDS:2, partial [Funneliformis geosporum]
QLQQSQYAYPDTLLGSAPITDAPFINANALMRSSSHITQSDDISHDASWFNLNSASSLIVNLIRPITFFRRNSDFTVREIMIPLLGDEILSTKVDEKAEENKSKETIMDYHEEIIVPSTRKPTERCVYVRLLLSISPVVSTLAWQFNNPAPKKKLLEKFRKKEEEAMKKRNRIREMRNKFATNSMGYAVVQ